MSSRDGSTAVTYEDEHVHHVYEQIASHFSSTRYKPWPIVERFLQGLPDGAVGVDVGCGNGKYLTVNPKVFILASDRSQALTKIAAQHQPHAALIADNLSLPHPPSSFDFAISIAVIHHLSTPARRVEAIKSVLELLKPNRALKQESPNGSVSQSPDSSDGRALIYVWALEQKNSRRGWDEGMAQDVMVPWVTKSSRGTSSKPLKRNSAVEHSETRQSDLSKGSVTAQSRKGESLTPSDSSQTFYRYYHLYRAGELEQDVSDAGGTVIESGYEKDNWWAIIVRNSEP
ncbi:S-adenosyl-L-methionine-dependent methyltransferase [Xylona heveae TC161]|uniref:S-adenosyl-L-methionine-dependent methyltransferase n=1 Tax=Xylona heveae (strain CBS 132557 / TC161) TaxID=1328760 RepID=A0A165F8L0_XYLHT|nr:S-adenosyl-L-methionine-dependent methyltransferase [Xylona heveae TC161]KZF20704.1 S-adenosyl-L-methionine-dependent methyltransferase [Xylona heveae TC161]